MMRKNCDVSSAFSASLVQQTNRLLSEWVFFINFNAYKFQSNSGGAEEFGKSVKMFSALRRSPETSDEYS